MFSAANTNLDASFRTLKKVYHVLHVFHKIDAKLKHGRN